MPASWAADSVRPGGSGPACRHRTGAANASAAAALRDAGRAAVVAPADEQRHRVRGPGAVEVDEHVRPEDHLGPERRRQALGRLARRVTREGAREVRGRRSVTSAGSPGGPPRARPGRGGGGRAIGAPASSSARARQAATPSNSSPWTPPTTDSVGPSAEPTNSMSVNPSSPSGEMAIRRRSGWVTMERSA